MISQLRKAINKEEEKIGTLSRKGPLPVPLFYQLRARPQAVRTERHSVRSAGWLPLTPSDSIPAFISCPSAHISLQTMHSTFIARHSRIEWYPSPPSLKTIGDLADVPLITTTLYKSIIIHVLATVTGKWNVPWKVNVMPYPAYKS